jgi:chemotaxis protein MotB
MSGEKQINIDERRFPRSIRHQLPTESASTRDRWLLTYADLITLLLAFFIIMFSMSHLDAKRFGKVSRALSGVLSGETQNPLLEPEFDDLEGSGPLKISRHRVMMRSLEQKAFEQGIDGKKFETEITERGLVIHIMESALFQPGGSKLSSGAMRVLDLVASELDSIPNHVRVEGHTDNSPISTGRFPSNWELSSARATEVVRYFINAHGLSGQRVSALGYGQYRPIRPNNTPENRAKNRRVDVVVLTNELSRKEPSSALFVRDARQ